MAIKKHLYRYLRQRRRLEEDDEKDDSIIGGYTPDHALREVVAWHLGDPGWAGQIIQWARDCGYEIKP